MSGFQSNIPVPNIQASEPSPDQKKEEKDKNSLFVLYLPPTFKDQDLQKLFQDYGEVESVKVIMDHSTNFNKGYGFVNMKTRIGAKRAMVSLNGHRIGSKYLKVSIKTKKESHACPRFRFNRKNRPRSYLPKTRPQLAFFVFIGTFNLRV